MDRSPRMHPAWVVLGALTLCMLAVSGLRSTFGVYIKPMEAEFGWSRGALSGAAALSLLLLGAAGPFVGRLADRWDPRRIILASLVLVGAGAIASAFVHRLWQIYATVGVVMALGAGGIALTTSSSIVARWFEARRGLAIGISAAGMSAGQLAVIPMATALTRWLGWRSSFLWLGIGLLALVFPIALAFIRSDPAEYGLRPYGATSSLSTVVKATATRADERVSVTEAAQTRFGSRGPLATYYFVRGLSLVFLLYVWNVPSLHLWAAVFGLNYISTVPPTTTLTANIYGRYSVGELSGWIFFAHQVGAALGAALAGFIFEWTGSYAGAFVSASVLAFIAAGLALGIREAPIVARPMSPAPAAV